MNPLQLRMSYEGLVLKLINGIILVLYVPFFLHQMQHLSCVCYERCVCDLKVVSDVNAVGDTGAVGDPAAVGDNCRFQLLTLRNRWMFVRCMGGQCPLFSDVIRLGAFFSDVFR